MADKRLVFSVEDVLVCLENAVELRRDARRSTAETEAVLLTLAIEEAAKGFVVAFERKLAAEGLDIGSADSLARVGDPGLRKLLERHQEVLTVEAVRLSFREHGMKQRHLTFVADFCLYLAPMSLEIGPLQMVFTPGIPLTLRIRAFFWYLDHRHGQLNDRDRELLTSLDSVDFASLETIRKRALYVGLDSPRGGCAGPTVDEATLNWLEEIADLLIGMLDGMWIVQSANRRPVMQ